MSGVGPQAMLSALKQPPELVFFRVSLSSEILSHPLSALGTGRDGRTAEPAGGLDGGRLLAGSVRDVCVVASQEEDGPFGQCRPHVDGCSAHVGTDCLGNKDNDDAWLPVSA